MIERKEREREIDKGEQDIKLNKLNDTGRQQEPRNRKLYDMG